MPPLPLSARSRRTADSPISYFIRKAIETPGLISLAAGLVDESSLPAEEIAAATSELMADPIKAKAALQYGSTQGLPALRQKVLDRFTAADGVSAKDLNLTADDVLLTTGSQQLLYLLGEALFDVGDIVIAEAPSYFVYHDCLKSHGADVRSVPMDAGGMCLDSLEKLLTSLEASGELPRVKLVYTVDYFQNPTGLSLAADRRAKLVQLVRKFSKKQRIVILEDAAYRELRYDGPDVASIKKHDPENEYVVYASTFSKPCSPGLKTGYAIVPKDLVLPLCNLKGNHDFGSTNLSQHLLNHLIGSGAYDRHVVKLQQVYRTKRDALVGALKEEFADWPAVTYTTAGGGLYSWVTFPEKIDTGKDGPLVQRALDAGVLYVPGEYGHVPDANGKVRKNEARLSFGVAEPPQLIEAVRRLRKACRGLE
jgi:2-aminoadipate transaminase